MAVSEEQNQQETITSVDESELEQYGVWVKAGPEDVIEAEAEDEAFSLDDLSEDALTDAQTELLAAEEPAADVDLEILSDELEEVSLDTLDLESGTEEVTDPADEQLEATPEGPEPVEDLGESDLLTLEEDDLTIDLGPQSDELGVDVSEELQIEPDAILAEPLDSTDELADLGEELTLEDLAEEAVSPPEVASAPPVQSAGDGGGIVDDDLNIEEDLPDDLNDLTLDLDELDVDSFEESSPEATEEPGEIEELDLSTLPADEDTFDEISPEDLTQADEGELPELSGEEELTELTLDEAFEDAIPTADGDVAGSGEEDLLILDEEPEGNLLEEMDTEEDLLDLSDLTDEVPTEDTLTVDTLTEDTAAKAPDDAFGSEAVSESATSDRSMSLLENIERELSSIRSELGDLKRELGQLRGISVAAAPTGTPDQPEDEADAVGFFEGSEDDDETIALTGTELDNIMNTAEITEESGSPTDFEDMIGPTDAPTLDELVPEADEPATPITEISLEETPKELDPIEIDLDSDESSALGGSDDEIEVLAGMDIDAELADIEELEDTSDSFTGDAEGELADLDLGNDTPIAVDDDLILDAEPIEELDLSDEPSVELPVETPPPVETPIPADPVIPESDAALPDNLKVELRSVLQYMDQLLESLPEEKIQEFAQSDHFTVYRRLFEELGLEQ